MNEEPMKVLTTELLVVILIAVLVLITLFRIMSTVRFNKKKYLKKNKRAKKAKLRAMTAKTVARIVDYNANDATWDEADCTTETDEDSVMVEYVFEAYDEEYSGWGNILRLGKQGESGKRLDKRYLGRKIKIHYNPENPNESVTDYDRKNMSNPVWVCVFMLAMVAVAIAMYLIK